jgi:hypothetical protein
MYFKHKTPALIADRETVSKSLWRKTATGFEVVTDPLPDNEADDVMSQKGLGTKLGTKKGTTWKGSHQLASTRNGTTDSHATKQLAGSAGSAKAVRGKARSATRLTLVNGCETKLDFVAHMDLGGVVPSWISNQFVGRTLSSVARAQNFFLEQRCLDEYDEEDGKALAYRLLYPSEELKKTPAKAVASIVRAHKGLRELEQELPWLTAFLEVIVQGQLMVNARAEQRA